MTLLDLLDDRAGQHANKTAFQFLNADGTEGPQLTYGELHHRVLVVAAGLQQELPPAAAVLLALPTGPAAVVAFLGALYAGARPALLPPPRHPKDRRSLALLQQAATVTAAARVFLSPDGAEAAAALDLPGGVAIAADCTGLGPHRATDWRRPAIAPESPAYLQFSSGSTARPKCVILSHRAVLANLELIGGVFGHGEDLVGLGWLPLHHDMGLVGHVLHPIHAAGTSVLAPPAWFSRHPLGWLDAIARYRVTTSGAPPFGYDLCTRQAQRVRPDLDLGGWRVAYVGAEPVSETVLEAFAARFAPSGFQRRAFLPCYGLAEATLLVAGAQCAQGWRLAARKGPNQSHALLRYPIPEGGLDVRIVDPAGRAEVAPGAVGEILLAGTSIADGYYGASEETERTFVELVVGNVSRRYVRTGDLGYRDGDDLVITGRAKDLIIIRGVNLHPEDLEETVRQSHPLLRHEARACFAVPGPATEKVIVAQEIKPPAAIDRAMVEQAIRDALAQDHELDAEAVVLVNRGALARTTSGKVSRTEVRRAYLDGQLGESRAPATADVIRGREPIAVIGMACRFPGADGPDAYWSVLAEGLDVIREVPADRWEVDAYYHERAAVPGKMNTRWGGFLDNVDRFDAELFGIAPHEAVEMDPQQRLLLEVAWRAFEHAGQPLDRLAGSDTGVYVGIATSDYLQLQIKLRAGMEEYNAYTGLGTAQSISANRLSYVFDLHGPSLAVDTACSSSLTALHLAVQGLRNGECSLAVAGGVNLILSPGTSVALSQFNMMAPDGRCKVFDASANGYVRSEGCGLVVLKRLRDAERDGDRILGIIRGTAANQDGRTPGITTPNPEAQRRVIERALADADCRPEEVTLVEAHGTGTSAGDPAELGVIRRIYGEAGDGAVCHVGAVKANVGHLEAAAGIASFIKLLLAMGRREIPPQIHLRALNPRITLAGSRIAIAQSRGHWDAPHERRIAAVSSFGFGGANVHMIVEAPATLRDAARPEAADDEGPWLVPLSARNEAALAQYVEAVSHWVDESGAPLRTAAAVLARRRTHFAHRAAVVAEDADALRRGLQNSIRGEPGRAAAGVAFLFSGQGSQYPGMGSALYRRFSGFRDAFDRCAAAFSASAPGGPDLAEVAFAADSRLLDTVPLLQPALFAVEYASACLWRALGIEPAAVAGHSLGEFAAACVAGCFEPEDGMRLVTERARLMAGIERRGAMAAVALSEAQAAAFLAETATPELTIAAVNAAGSVVFSGPEAAVMAAIAALEQRGIAARRLRTPHAFHSALMDPILDAFEQSAARVRFHPPQIPLYSNLTGTLSRDAPDAGYWRRHLREPVRFHETVEALSAGPIRQVIEVGPGDALVNLVRRRPDGFTAVTTLDRNAPEVAGLLGSVGRLYADGAAIEWSLLVPDAAQELAAALPGHPFRPKRYWFAATDPGNSSPMVSPATSGRAKEVALPDAGWVYQQRWTRRDLPRQARIHEPENQNWIVIGNGAGLGAELASRLVDRRRQVFHVVADAGLRAGRTFRRSTDRATGVTRLLMQHDGGGRTYAEVLNEIVNRLARVGTERWSLVYLAGLDCTPPEETSALTLERDQRLFGPGAMTSLVQGILGSARAAQVWVVTAGAQPVHLDREDRCADDVHLAQASIWGFAHTMFLEHPEMRGGLIDLAPQDGIADRAAQVLAALSAGDDEPWAAFRNGARHVPRLTPERPKTRSPTIHFQRQGSYLVTGGLGGLGLQCAAWLGEKGAGHVVLLGRRGLPERTLWDTAEGDERDRIDAIRAIEAAGTTVEVVALDVADHDAVGKLIRRIDASDRPLRGVLHAAGLNWYSRIADLDHERLLETLKIKVSAAWNLHRLTCDKSLDCFILFSSVSALWGSVDLAHYSAANHFLDALAYHRVRAEQPALSIDWGPWALAGMSARPSEVRLLTKLGFRLLQPPRAIAVMEALLADGVARAVVADVDWEQFQAFIDFSASPAFFERVSTGADGARPAGEVTAQQILDLLPADAHARLVAVVRQALAAVLLQEPGQPADLRQRFNLMGMDSLMAIAFAQRLESLTGLRMQTTLAYNYPSVLDVAAHLYELIRGEPPADRMSAPAPIRLASNLLATWFPTLAGAAPDRPRLFCFPYAGAGASVYRRWIDALDLPLAVVPVQLPGREDRAAEPPAPTMSALAAPLADAVEAALANNGNGGNGRDYAFFGHSLGGLTAFEVTRELRRRGVPLPQHLILSGCAVPESMGGENLRHLSDEALRHRTGELFATPQEVLASELVWRAILPALRADVAVLETYRPAQEPPLDVPVSLFGGTQDRFASREKLLAWSDFVAGDLTLRTFEGGHMFLRSAEEAVLAAIRDILADLRPAARAAVLDTVAS